MLSKDKKPDEKVKEVVPPRAETPKLFSAMLKMSQQQGLQGTFRSLRKTFKTSDGTAEVSQMPPLSPTHRRSPIPRITVQDGEDAVSETPSITIRMTPRREGEETLSVEVP
ncbi:hypothetical protein CesoFtcFv8_000500 [Champsocephalus esox]|uniref:Uncharacterized protein n=1 Tax=Champsocephalus esox TaxID=159716 RepID=A0AAN8D3Y7_9TELE|nr:hypothetical protein CesoFtcFv8_000500 [Champsocephalus esox]